MHGVTGGRLLKPHGRVFQAVSGMLSKRYDYSKTGR